MLRPTFQEFLKLADRGTHVPVYRVLPFDTETPITAYAKLARAHSDSSGTRFGFLLESLVGGEKWARWTFLGARPQSAWRLQPGGRVSTWSPAEGWSEPVTHDDPIADLDRRIRDARPVTLPELPRFAGGAVGYLGYDVVRYFERLPHAPPDRDATPDALLVFTDVVLAIDNVFDRALAITHVDVRGADSAALKGRYEDAVGKLEAVLACLNAPPPPPLALRESGAPLFQSSVSRERFERDVDRIRDYIRAGDAYQVVLSQRLAIPLTADPFEVYRALRSVNPSPYLYFLELDGLALVGSSPEVMVRLEDGRVTVRPLAGTRPRGHTDAEDEALIAELLADEKERAEHLMLVDLGRNDVGRIARYGSVRVSDFMNIERYSHVLHMVSQVEGDLLDGKGAIDVFRACFPAGTVSGAPKIRAMEIIDELETVRRGCYAGAVGYFALGGEAMDTAIAIRTLVAHGGSAHVQAGAGIVADSVPSREFEETLSKAGALLSVLGMLSTDRSPA
jgi:anthranilate synthase component 1